MREWRLSPVAVKKVMMLLEPKGEPPAPSHPARCTASKSSPPIRPVMTPGIDLMIAEIVMMTLKTVVEIQAELPVDPKTKGRVRSKGSQDSRTPPSCCPG